MANPYKDEDYQYKPVDYYDSTDVGADELFMSPEDLAASKATKAEYEAAKAKGDQAGMDAAHAKQEERRAKYGYQGGANGGAYNPLAKQGGTGGQADTFTYGSAPEYMSKKQAIIDAALEQLRSRPAFSYDPEQDPTYQQYKEQYTRQGKLAMEDTLGQMAARTGGLASSYAGSAAQQSYNQYMAALSDKIPELRQLAYEMYRAEGDDMRADLNLLLNMEQMGRSAFESDRGQFNTEQNFKYGLWSDQKEREYRADQTAYQRTVDADKLAYERGRDQVDDQWRQTEWDYGVQQDALAREDQDRQEAVSRIDTYLRAGGAVDGIPPELLQQSGFSDMEINALAAHYAKLNSQSDQEFNAKMAASQAKGKSGGGSGDGDKAGGSVYSSLYKAGIRSEGEAYAWLLSAGYNTTQAGKLAKYYAEQIVALPSEEEEESPVTVTGMEMRHSGNESIDPLLQMGGKMADKYFGSGPVSDRVGSVGPGVPSFLYKLTEQGDMGMDDLGAILSAPNGGAMPSQGYEGVTRQLMDVEDMGIGDAAKAGQIIQIIQTAQQKGTIREDEAKYLFRQYGLMD